MKNYLELIKGVKIGDTFKDLKIDGLNRTESDSVFQELARMDNKQLSITFADGTFLYEVVKPSKKFLNKEGQWRNTNMSKKAENKLNEILAGGNNMNMVKTLKNLKKLIGETYEYNDIICAFEGNKEDIIVNDNTNTTMNFDEYGKCDLILAYENTEDSIEFEIYVDNNGVIVEVV